jgi:hypothetical protein
MAEAMRRGGVGISIVVLLGLPGQVAIARQHPDVAVAATELDDGFVRQSLAATTAKTWYLAIEPRQLLT